MSSINQINDDQTDLKKEELAENVIKKWLTLQILIKHLNN